MPDRIQREKSNERKVRPNFPSYVKATVRERVRSNGAYLKWHSGRSTRVDFKLYASRSILAKGIVTRRGTINAFRRTWKTRRVSIPFYVSTFLSSMHRKEDGWIEKQRETE